MFREIFILIICLYFSVNSKTLRSCLEKSHSTADIVLRGDAKYPVYNFQWNLRILIYPRGYIVVKSTEDVKVALKCLLKKKLKFRMRSGGHSREKYSFGDNDSFVIDLSRLNTVKFNPETNIAIVGAGIRAISLIKRLWVIGKYGLPVGSCPTIGISGYTLGGGLGVMVRNVGLMSDNVVEMEVVTAEQNVIRVNRYQHSDLFWALRGSGGGNFGIVTKFHLKTFNASAKMITSTIEYSTEQFAVVFNKWVQWAKTNPKPLIHSSIYYNIFTSGTFVVKFVIYSLNFSESTEALKSVKLYFNEVDDTKNIEIKPFINSLYPGFNSTKPSMVYEKHKTFFVSKYLNSSEINRFHKQLMEHNYVSFFIQLCGGAVNAKAANETAFCHRSTVFGIDYGVTVHAKNETDFESTINTGKALKVKFEKFAESIQFMSNGEAYINAIDADEKDALRKYYCDNLNELKKVKRKYDPKDVFNFPLSIPL